MRTKRLGNLVGLSLLVSFLALGDSAFAQARGNLPAPSEAKAKLTAATAAAKAWKADAILIQIVGRRIGVEGTIPTWDYGFWSATAKTCLVVNIYVRPPASTQESGGAICSAPELKEFIDSGQAMKIARSNGITAPTATMVVSTSPGIRGAPAKTIWNVMDNAGVKTGDVMLDIDAVSGAILHKTVQR
jgi:hypothetical protein